VTPAHPEAKNADGKQAKRPIIKVSAKSCNRSGALITAFKALIDSNVSLRGDLIFTAVAEAAAIYVRTAARFCR